MLPLVSVGQQLLLVVEQLDARLGGVLKVRALDNGVDRTRLLAEAAVDALGHVDVVARCAARAVLARLGFDRNRLFLEGERQVQRCGEERRAGL